MNTGLRVLAAVTLAATLVGCGSDNTNTPTDAAPQDTGATSPTVRVASPATGATFTIGAPTRLTIETTNFMLVPFMGMSGAERGRGHYHIYLDAADGMDYLVADHNPTPSVTIPAGTSVGPHTLRISLRNHDHSAVTPAVDTTLPIVVNVATTPTVTINAPADGTSVMAGAAVTLQLAVQNFMLAPPAMGPNRPGFGHYHVYLDNATGSDYLVADQVPSPMVTIPPGTTAGDHNLVVSLREINHEEIGPTSRATLRIRVTR